MDRSIHPPRSRIGRTSRCCRLQVASVAQIAEDAAGCKSASKSAHRAIRIESAHCPSNALARRPNDGSRPNKNACPPAGCSPVGCAACSCSLPRWRYSIYTVRRIQRPKLHVSCVSHCIDWCRVDWFCAHTLLWPQPALLPQTNYYQFSLIVSDRI